MAATKRKSHKHAFRFQGGGGKEAKIITCWAKVIRSTTGVYLALKAEHVRESIKRRGVGNTQTCSMAICAQSSQEAFPHSVEGFIDWFYSRAYVVSRCDKNGLPSECYLYEHSDGIAQLNDTKGGQKKLLEELEQAGGERIIHLRPAPRYKGGTAYRKTPAGRRDGSRTKVLARGAKLRFAVAQMGGVAA